MALNVRFATLEGKFAIAKRETFPTSKAALDAILAYAEAAGYKNVKEVDDFGDETMRYTADPPEGRKGRNVAFADYDDDPGL